MQLLSYRFNTTTMLDDVVGSAWLFRCYRWLATYKTYILLLLDNHEQSKWVIAVSHTIYIEYPNLFWIFLKFTTLYDNLRFYPLRIFTFLYENNQIWKIYNTNYIKNYLIISTQVHFLNYRMIQIQKHLCGPKSIVMLSWYL